jgi:hypothetical protein
MDTSSDEVSGLFENMLGSMGVMSDRIVWTECEIMYMSHQIGYMADRIVYTE